VRRALIGYTGFVGSNFDAPGRFDGRFNSKNVEALAGSTFDEVWCAGVNAVKWWANQNPETDWAQISRLLEALKTVRAAKFVLISTVDVYRDPVAVDEDTPVSVESHHAYGAHRLRVERFIAERFADHCIIRLPGLYGAGLKKNLIFDVLNKRPIDGFDADSTFQFYGLDRLWMDAERASESGLRLINFAVEPLSVRAVVERLTGAGFENHTKAPPVAYDMRTKHGALWGRQDAYMQSADMALEGIGAYGAVAQRAGI
jgi:nucleoside-diphosphate-sugar epimerase